MLVGIVLIISSYTTRTSGSSEGIYPGNFIPKLKIEEESGKSLNLEHLKGVKVLINFWAAYDAESHLTNTLLWNTLKKEEYPVVMLSVSFDESKSVYKNTLRMDQIDERYQFHEAKGEDSQIYKQYQLEKGFKNYLIDENGKILAMNLTPNDLKEFFN